ALTVVTGLLLFLNRSQAFLHGIWVLLLPVLIGLLAIDGELRAAGTIREYQRALLHLIALFTAAMVCHGELARTRPAAAHLTEFYLLISLGGVLGGLFNALLAPVLFHRIIEYPLIIAVACLLMPRFGVRTPGWFRQLDRGLAGLTGLIGFAWLLFFVGNASLTP